MEELIQLIAKTYGIVGMLLIAPLGAAIVLYLDHRKAQAIHKKEIDEWEAKLAKAQAYLASLRSGKPSKFETFNMMGKQYPYVDNNKNRPVIGVSTSH